MKHPMVTFTITSGKRPQLFYRTMDSFLEMCEDKDLISEWICSDDGTSEQDFRLMKEKYPFMKFYRSPKQGQAANLNFLFSKVKTIWAFHVEDDWRFVKSGQFIHDMLDVTFDNERIKNVVLRDWDGIFVKSGDLEYQVHASIPADDDSNWYGHSLNPGLQQMPVLRNMGKFDENEQERYFDRPVARKYYESGYLVACLGGKYIEHIGIASSLYGIRKTERLDNKKPNLWTYWENIDGREMPYYISLCLESIKRKCGKDFNVRVLDETTRLDYLENTGLLGQAFSLSSISQKVDTFRVALLKYYGGIWVDADTLVLKSLKPIYDKMNKDWLYMRWNDGRVLNGYMAGQRYAPIFSEWLDKINNQLKTMSKEDLESDLDMAYWARFGEKILTKLLPMYEKQGTEIDKRLLLPIDFDRDSKIFFKKGVVTSYLTTDTFAIGLNHSAFWDFGRSLATRTKKEFHRGKDLLADIVMYAERIL